MGVCKKCSDALAEHWGHLSDKDKMSVLWSCTCFPAGDGDEVAKQLRESKKKSGGDFGLAMQQADEEITSAMGTVEERYRESRAVLPKGEGDGST